MSDATLERSAAAAPAPIASPRELLPYAIFAAVLMLVLVYFVGAEQGATSLFSGSYVHELVHDARHLLGFPCH
ncbi:MAG: CbtB-domain containing protein [Conexibacter sp.]|jgi:cobalt transporter subunit CbtB|nr:CbtB-domain containing protein [Conexibacter sp.]